MINQIKKNKQKLIKIQMMINKIKKREKIKDIYERKKKSKNNKNA